MDKEVEEPMILVFVKLMIHLNYTTLSILKDCREGWQAVANKFLQSISPSLIL
ncbi:hypothetical protein HYPBUDRAFT_151112 [Hyphopichia burtonii NRRL Y-1933]|uniref:Uncharacterized protein n=1 Tax=Hyphopichia burtonii NRRL Y-1933 TaxID=984485 RepID=A0A1E4RPX6_9ASCO|nr:hypothetical protein HYPBUDRAFT_151112 [Hyphopichia burtonii NRRL Y-1933]ODV69276.1 hypothetical protein HYPBUDRAFT_151112 [Hyphopichia burtonii NRRL Y-1933]